MEQPELFFRTSQIAELAAVEQRRVERLLDGENVFLDGIAQRPTEKKHRRFSILDGLRVQLILALNEHGVVPAKVASGIVEKLLKPYPNFVGSDELLLDEKLQIIFHALQFSHAHVWFDEQQEKWVCASFVDRIDGSREFFGTAEATRQMAENSRDVYITVNLARMTRNYFERLEKLLPKQGEK